ncbi:MAG: undecaprenyl/decaprenyl-phosphate alpha-N-acetylglucosaminyl 1-phosphate transferase [Saprospiraceae bacterium]|nr:undecaprenyl/decaprenyl-phosphate alpha-N-acetylglucosaminyl 1-phosphate transferase [Saprospiraceae bacterium]
MEIIMTSLIALLLAKITIPAWKMFALKINLVDKPNARKKHQGEIPVVGGIAVFTAGLLSISLSLAGTWNHVLSNPMIVGATILLILGAIDDRIEIKATIKLMIQVLVAGLIVWQGTIIESLHGLFGIHDLPGWVASLLTVLVIVGTINAFNLIDGIDGLAGGLFIIVLMSFGALALWLEIPSLAIPFFAFGSALIAFLRQNLSKEKIFLGDGGSLSLGFIIVSGGIQLFNASNSVDVVSDSFSERLVLGLLLLPVLDSFRVYFERIMIGNSPFKADRRHIHHLFVNLGLTHRKSTLLIIMTSVSMIGILVGSAYFHSLTSGLILSMVFFLIIIKIVLLGNHVLQWTSQIKRMEKA